MELIAYLHPAWAPLIRPAPSTREWMDNTSDAFAYRCLPLNIANAHGWEILSPISFDAVWDGGDSRDAITIRMPPGTKRDHGAVSIFGHGVLTFHIESIFRTPPGWNLWIGGSPNRQKDGIQALTGVMETDWTPFTFTMNWRFTRPNHWVHFDALEPMCFIFPVQRGILEEFEPRMESMPEKPELMQAYSEWSDARLSFTERTKLAPPKKKSESWQKHYMRGVDTRGNSYIDDHRTKLRLAPFDTSRFPNLPPPPMGKDHEPDQDDEAAATPAKGKAPAAVARIDAEPGDGRALRRREWLLGALERQRALSARMSSIPRLPRATPEVFLDLFYAAARPVVLTGLLGEGVEARFTPEALRKRIGSKIVDLEGGATMPFDQFLRAAAKAESPETPSLSGETSARNGRVLAPLLSGLDGLAPFLAPAAAGRVEASAAGAVATLRHALENRLTVQLAGRRRFKLLPPSEAANLYEGEGVLSEIADLDSPAFSLARFPRVANAKVYEITLDAGEALFLPVGWWRQSTALGLSLSATFTNFAWANGAAESYPAAAL